MPTHRVLPGDCIASIAAHHDYADWQAIWDHPAHAELRALRRSPSVLLDGDVVVLPDKLPAEVEVESGKLHRFRVRVPQVRLRLELNDRRGAALASRRFEILVDGQTLSGTTDASGRLDEAIPALAKEARLRLFLDDDRVLEVPLAVGHLDPEDTTSGVRQRLRNLGYLRERSPSDDVIERALREFQRDNGLEATGTADDATRDHLRTAHEP
jgi:hypothetical protein